MHGIRDKRPRPINILPQHPLLALLAMDDSSLSNSNTKKGSSDHRRNAFPHVHGNRNGLKEVRMGASLEEEADADRMQTNKSEAKQTQCRQMIPALSTEIPQ
jgi:hypothetical protein